MEKGQTHWDGFDDKIISMYAGGMSYEEIRTHLGEIYGVSVSKDFISTVTDKVLDDVRAWQTRPIDDCYLVVWIDALVVKVRVDGVVRNRPAYLVLGLNLEGKKEALSLVIGTGDESAKFWLKVLTDLRNRGLAPGLCRVLRRAHRAARSDRGGLHRRMGAVLCRAPDPQQPQARLLQGPQDHRERPPADLPGGHRRRGRRGARGVRQDLVAAATR